MTDENNPFPLDEDAAPAANLMTIDLEFETVRRFREDMAPYLNYDGCFVRSKKPLARGVEVRFRFLLPEDFVLAQGNAVVAWVIKAESNPDLVPGMALRFTTLDQQAKEVIDELVDFHIATGGDPFDLGPGASAPGEILTDALEGGEIETGLAADTPTVPMPEAVPEPPPVVANGGEALPSWLSEVANESNFEVTLEDEAAIPEAAPPEISPIEDLSPLLEELEVKMVDDEKQAQPLPAPPSVKPAINIPRMESARQKAPRDLRLGLLVAAAIVLVAVSVLMWTVLRGQKSVVAPEPIAVDAGVALPAEELGDPPETQDADPPETQDADPPGQALILEEPPVDTPVPTPVFDRQATRVVDIIASARGDVTTVEIRGDGYFSEDTLLATKLEDPARLWLRVRGIKVFYRPNEIEIGSAQVLRVRVGHHPEDVPQALWVVLDLADDSAVLVDQKVDGNTIRITVGRP